MKNYSTKLFRNACLFVITFLLLLHPLPSFADTFTRAEAALAIAKHFQLTTTSDPKTLYGLFDYGFPGGYDGTQEFSYYDQPITLEVAIVVLGIYSGWDVVHYPADLAKKVSSYVTPEGYPYYGPDPTPRSIPFVVLALQKGLLKESELSDLRKPIGAEKLEELFKRLDVAQETFKSKSPFKIMQDEEFKNQKAFAASLSSPFQLVVVPHGLPPGNLSSDITNPFLDLRGANLRLIQGPGLLRDGKQDYFPLGALQTTFTAGLAVPADALYHQGQALYGVITNSSPTVNAIGLWGAASSLDHAARVWGGFISATSATGDDKDAQIVGLEVDVTNRTLPGLSPNRSKTGLQVAGMGDTEVSNAVELMGFNKGLWQNGVLVEEHTISKTGTAFAVGQSEPMKIGLDLGHTRFTDAAISISNGSLVSFESNKGPNAAIYSDDINGGSLVLRASKAGVRITNNQNDRNLLWIQPDGSISWTSKLIQHYFPFFVLGWMCLAFSVYVNLYLFREIKKLKSRVPSDQVNSGV